MWTRRPRFAPGWKFLRIRSSERRSDCDRKGWGTGMRSRRSMQVRDTPREREREREREMERSKQRARRGH
ncbi:hypothetical protein FA13DRAFT_1088341 [Coprinellus micaceus]|uniref:Uncharacterized protein n=1 Tax=Coprinellus micaceus TaxID=71717 RepID=A0A4Y7TRP4_COPMI|nr:hypothetical protein FA13DRAFT_1088341 [Coprinellus micaceus]